MSVYMISFSLNNPTSCNYEPLYTAIKEYEIWAHALENIWLIFIPETSVNINLSGEIMSNLQQYIDDTDTLFIAKLSGEAAWLNIDQNDNDDAASLWLHYYLDKA